MRRERTLRPHRPAALLAGLALSAVLAVCAGPSPARAQPGEPFSGEPQDAALPSAVPLVDEVVPPAPREVIAQTTLALYDLVLAHKGDCPALATTLDDFMDTHGDAIAQASQAIAAAAPTMTEEDLAELGAYFAQTISGDPRTAAAQAALYPCLRSWAGQTRNTRIDRKMQRFFALHEAMLKAIVGNVD